MNAAKTFTRNDWVAAKAELDAVEKERDELARAALEPTRERWERAQENLERIEDELPDRVGTCEGCLTVIWNGEPYSYDHVNSLYFCEACSPSYADMLADPSTFYDAEGEYLTAGKAKALVDAHIAAGGSAEDKMVSP